jgi:2-polyprenyl-6-methoxyphenol hydroxylase-like FAD-dependent oxidoreductase
MKENFVLADVHMDWPVSREEVTLFFSPAGMVVVAPLPAERFRIVATVADAPEQPQMDYMQAILDARGPASGSHQIRDIVWSSRFRLQHRVAATARKGRVLLCGDAAHVHSPAGGQGMNLGIQDAVALAQPLVRALQTGDDSDLNSWADKRHRAAQEVLSMTDKMTRAATLESAPARLVRNAALGFAGHLPGIPNMIARKLAELDSR